MKTQLVYALKNKENKLRKKMWRTKLNHLKEITADVELNQIKRKRRNIQINDHVTISTNDIKEF